MAKIKVRLTTLEGMLGTSPANEQVYREFIGSKAEDATTVEDEVAALGVDAVADKGRTVFPRLEDGTPFMYDYQIKGFFKDACSMLQRAAKSADKVPEFCRATSKIKAHKKIIDGLIFPEPRKIPIIFDGEILDCQRPLRAQTAQGERVSLASSDEIPAGAQLEFDIESLDESVIPAIREWLDYGRVRGLGQWRNSGKGRFLWDELDESGNVIGGNNAHTKAG